MSKPLIELSICEVDGRLAGAIRYEFGTRDVIDIGEAFGRLIEMVADEAMAIERRLQDDGGPVAAMRYREGVMAGRRAKPDRIQSVINVEKQ